MTNSERANSSSRSRYTLRRERARRAVVDATLRHLGDHAVLLGSWRVDEFHLAYDTSVSFSDLDIFDPHHVGHEETTWSINTDRDHFDLRVSIHPEDYVRELRPAGRLVLAMFNLATAQRASVPVGYVRAKSYLVLSSHGQGLCYAEMTAHGEFGELALDTKRGVRNPQHLESVAGFREALAAHEREARRLVGADHDTRALVRSLTDRRMGINARFASYLRAKFNEPEAARRDG